MSAVVAAVVHTYNLERPIVTHFLPCPSWYAPAFAKLLTDFNPKMSRTYHMSRGHMMWLSSVMPGFLDRLPGLQNEATSFETL